jgi:hypothetical protein
VHEVNAIERLYIHHDQVWDVWGWDADADMNDSSNRGAQYQERIGYENVYLPMY